MKNKTGIWIDSRKAVIIRLQEPVPQILKIESSVSTRERIPGEKRPAGRFGEQFVSAETKKQNRINGLMEKFLNRIIDELKQEEEIFIFGPSQTKIQLQNHLLENPKMANNITGIENADSMTENQLIARVRQFYENETIS